MESKKTFISIEVSEGNSLSMPGLPDVCIGSYHLLGLRRMLLKGCKLLSRVTFLISMLNDAPSFPIHLQGSTVQVSLCLANQVDIARTMAPMEEYLCTYCHALLPCFRLSYASKTEVD
jgi:hypothetical protein